MATKWLSYAEAARRIGRTDRNIRRWRREGMPMGWRVGADGQRERVVDEDVLLAWFREKLKTSPVHYYRMRALARENDLPDPTPPATLSRVSKPQQRITPESRETSADSPVRSAVAGSDRDADPLAHVKPMRGGPEYDALHRALRETPAPCRGVDEFTADRIDDVSQAYLAAICATCPVIDLCRAYADVAHPDGYWAGSRRR